MTTESTRTTLREQADGGSRDAQGAPVARETIGATSANDAFGAAVAAAASVTPGAPGTPGAGGPRVPRGAKGVRGRLGESAMLSRAVAFALVVLLVAFYAITVNNMVTISRQVDDIKSGPYPVSVAAGRVETLLVQLRTLSERPVYVRTAQALDNVEHSYASIDEDMREKVSFMAAHHDLDYESAQGLADGYDELARLQDEYLALCRDDAVTDEEVRRFATERIAPLVDDLLDADVGILNESTNSVENLYTTVTRLGFQTVVLASVLMAAVLLSLVVYLGMLKRKNEQQTLLQKNLEEALELAQSASAAKSQFLSNMSHDIRTPMNAIVGLTTIASSHLDDPMRVEECLGRISISSRHLLCLINDVLDMGKIESGKIVLNEARFSFPDMVSEIVTIVQPQAKAKKLKLDIVIGNIGGEVVVGDSMRLNQALLNLLGNAVKYTPEGGSVRLSISEGPCERPDFRRYRFVVQDTGIGMSESFLEKVFDPFERDGAVTASEIEGTGLGMAITKNVVDMMGGTIAVESRLGEGSTFTMEVPLRAVDDADDDMDLAQIAGMRVLVVDDDAAVLESTAAVMDEMGVRGSQAASGAEAVRLVSDAHRVRDDFRAVVVDWMMPGMDGIETARRIRDEVGDATPIILLTAYDWTEIETEAKEAGITACVSKPLFKSRLYHILADLCRPHEAPVAARADEARPVEGRVLLVEDNELNREIAKELIGQLGAEVEEACDGQEALDRVLAVEDGYYDLVFMDMKMPRMGGIEATERLCAAAARDGRSLPPIIAMTANAFNEDRMRALAAGMTGFTTKPIDMKELERTLRTYLR